MKIHGAKDVNVADIDAILAEIKQQFKLSDDEIVELASYISLRVKHMTEKKYVKQVHFFRATNKRRYFTIELERNANGFDYWINHFSEMHKSDWKDAASIMNGMTTAEDGRTFYDTEEVQE